MSAVRTRILFGDDTDLLGAVRASFAARPDLEVITAASSEEALRALTGPDRPRLVILPARGDVDGIAICRQLKSAGAPEVGVVLVLPATAFDLRDECFAAGADDVVFAPIDAAGMSARLESRAGAPFRSAPRATVDLAVHVHASAAGPVLECRALQISREALLIELPTGVGLPPAGMLLRAAFTLYEGGTLTVWTRAAVAQDRAVLRMVGLAEHELRAIDYFVDYYLKSATARAAVEEVTGSTPVAAVAPVRAAPVQEVPEPELLLEAEPEPAPRPVVMPRATPTARPVAEPTVAEILGIEIAPPSMPARSNPGLIMVEDLKATDTTIRQVVDTSLDAIAECATEIAAGREAQAKIPEGFSVLRMKVFVQKLAPAEVAALTGASPYEDILLDLLCAVATRIRLMELHAQIKGGGGTLDKQAAKSSAKAAIAEAQQIHKNIETALQARVKIGDKSAMRDLGPVSTGIVQVCVELKKALDTDVLGRRKQTGVGDPPMPVPAGPAKFEKPKEQPAGKAATASGSKKSSGPAQGPKSSTPLMIVILVVGVGVSAYFNRRYFMKIPEPEFRAPHVELELGTLRVWMVQENQLDLSFIVDDSWKHLSDAEKAAALEDFAKRAAEAHKLEARVIDATNNKELAGKAATQPPPGAATPAAASSPDASPVPSATP
jgi:DNA-binding response OmpR family regulator